MPLGHNTKMDDASNLVTSEIQSLREQNALLRNKLDRSVAKVMELQGGNDQVTDGDVRRRFEGMFSSIQNWVEEIEFDLVRQSRDFRDVFRDVFQDVVRQEDKDSLLLNLGLLVHDVDESGQIRWGLASTQYVDVRWLGTLDTCINIVLPRFLWYSLKNRIFDSPYPVGFQQYAQYGLEYIFKAIKEGVDGETKVGSYTFSKTHTHVNVDH